MSRHRVLRAFPHKNPLRRGQIIDTNGMRNLELLVRQRYLAPVEEETQPTDTESSLEGTEDNTEPQLVRDALAESDKDIPLEEIQSEIGASEPTGKTDDTSADADVVAPEPTLQPKKTRRSKNA